MNKRNDREATILRERRIALGLTQGQVATEAGIELRRDHEDRAENLRGP